MDVAPASGEQCPGAGTARQPPARSLL